MSSDNKKPRIPLGGKDIDKPKDGGDEKPNNVPETNPNIISDPFEEKPGIIVNDIEPTDDDQFEDFIYPFEVDEPTPDEETQIEGPFISQPIKPTHIPDDPIIEKDPKPLHKEIVLEIDPNTTYFFVFGTSAAGKSTMVSSLAYYLKAFAEGQVESISFADKENHLKGDFILDEMIRDVRKGKFVPGTRNLTDEELSSEINLQFKPNNYKKPHFPFCILEMAGEDLQKVKLRDFGQKGGILDNRINAYLKHPNCRMFFICAIDTDEPSESEDFIDKFLEYARKLGNDKNPVLITINKWDLVAEKYSDAEQYLKENAPIIYKKLYDPERSFSYMPFSIGKKGDGKDYIYDETDAKKIFEWMYEESIGESLYDIKPPSLLDKLFLYLKSKF